MSIISSVCLSSEVTFDRTGVCEKSHVSWITSVKPLPHICGRPWVNKSVEWQQSMQPSGNLQWSEMKPMGKCIKNGGSLSVCSRLATKKNRNPSAAKLKSLFLKQNETRVQPGTQGKLITIMTHPQRSVFWVYYSSVIVTWRLRGVCRIV